MAVSCRHGFVVEWLRKGEEVKVAGEDNHTEMWRFHNARRGLFVGD